MQPSTFLGRATRTSVMLSADVFQAGRAGSTAHRVTNISEMGMCIVQPVKMAVGDVVVLVIGRVEHMAADVMWVRAGLAGLRFHEPIDLALARARRVAGHVIAPPSAGWLAALNDPYAK
ncbi:PilZ domain-containing protein [Sphingomonas sp. PP-CE-3A-406]|uniref:PilZ domain-containing protein n=1 Tax=unclassified Sphingomonas TaxID=196159 RepID=UPI000EF9BDAB|nr:PilZ domain-containing protein [Sphingomonas sp. PP-CE-3A-406]